MSLLFENKQKSHSWYSDDLSFPPHLHQAVEIGFVEEGECVFSIENRTYHVAQGDLFIVFPNVIHSYESAQTKTLVSVVTTFDLKAFDTVLCTYMPDDPVLKRGAWEGSGLKTLFELLAADMAQETEAVLQGYYQAIVGKCMALLSLSERKKQDADELRKVLSYIDEHRTDEISRKQISRALGIGESVISRMFSETLKMSLPEYLNSVRIRDAARLLQQTNYSITEIAERSGFGSIRSFNRAFSECFHLSPSEYRNHKI